MVERTRQLEDSRQQLERFNRQLAQANKELEKLSIVARETFNAVVIMDANGDIEWANERFLSLEKMSLEQFIK